MASINTNASAMTALQTLTATNKNLGTTQNRISTGLSVGQASDNAAYWSIATTMRSDNKSMSSVQEALGFGAAQVDVAYTAMDAVKETLDNMKSKLVASQQPDIDKAKIQEEIKQLQNDLKTYAEAASFSGGNWLNVSENKDQKIVASFMRDSGNNISLGTIDVDTAKTALFNSAAEEYGMLQQGGEVEFDAAAAADVDLPVLADADDVEITDVFAHDFDGGDAAIVLEEGAEIRFDIDVNGESTRVTINRATLDAAGLTDGTITDESDLAAAFTAALESAGLSDKVSATAGAAAGEGVTLALLDDAGATVVFDDATDDADTYTLSVSNIRSSSNGNFFDATALDITSAEELDLTEYMQGIDKMLLEVTTAASDLGAIKTRVDSQQDFVGKIMDAIDRGVGQLVDADMQEESARLSALQVQQQLGIQSLSIANGNAQNILSLFR